MDKMYVVGGIREGQTAVRVEVITPEGDVKRHRLTLKIWQRCGYASGDVITHEQYDEIARLSERCEAVTRALRYLSEGVYSIRGLTDKLCRLGFTKEAAEAAVALALKRGLIDEEAQAAVIAEKQVLRLHRGPSRVVSELSSKGYPADIARRAAESIPYGAYDEALEYALAKKCKNGMPEDKHERDLLVASLVWMGFSAGRVIEKINELNE